MTVKAAALTPSMTELIAAAATRTFIPHKLAAAAEPYQEQLLAQQSATSTSPDADKLIPFNGYYIWPEKPGAFFAVDTNFVFKGDSQSSFFQVDLLVSLDGTSCERIPFTGSFTANQLVQETSTLGKIQATFTHTNTISSSDPTVAFVATCALEIGDPDNGPVATIKAATYNNPIGYDLFRGSYYDSKTPGKPPVLTIGENFQVDYDNGSGLQPLPQWVYNMNMYFFYFEFKGGSGRLIMGASPVTGLVCNNMIIIDSKTTVRTLQTIADVPSIDGKVPNLLSYELMSFSGYYPLNGVPGEPLAYLCVMGQYYAIEGTIPICYVQVGFSLDGVTASGFVFDNSMSFSNNELYVPASGDRPEIRLQFTRNYTEGPGTLVSVAGAIGQYNQIAGATAFNPVPLMAFGGVPMTSTSSEEQLTLNGPYSITLNGNTYDTFVYVPLMYILVTLNEVAANDIGLSLGTNGANGNACIVTQNNVPTSVFSIPG